MNGCKELDLSFTRGAFLGYNCLSVTDNASNSYTTSFYLNVSKISFEKISSNSGGVVVCKYDKNKNMISREFLQDFELGNNSLNLSENYYYRFSYNHNIFNNFKGYQCNVGIGSMSNELAFGSIKFNDTLNVIIPFIIVLIGFGLGFTLLRKLINKSNQGKAL